MRLGRMLQECGLKVTKLGRCPSMLMASVVHPTSVHLAYAQVALPEIGSSVSEAFFPESPLRTRRTYPLRGCKSPTENKTSLNIVSLRGATGLIAQDRFSEGSNWSDVEIVGWKTNDEWSRCIDVLTKASFSL